MIDPTICMHCGNYFEEDDLIIDLLDMDSDETYYVHKVCYHNAVDRELREMDLQNMT
jgi:hypothetical protein